MIQNGRALRQEHVPSELVHREGEVDALTAALGGGRSGIFEDVIITGKSGAGKTSTTRYVLQKLKRARLDVDAGYVDCTSASSATSTLAGVVRDSGRGAPLNPKANTQMQLVQRLREADTEFVAVLDEADVLEDKSVIHALYGIDGLTTVLITVNYDDLFMNCDRRVEKRMRTFRHIEFDPYHDDELVDILQGRVEVGLEPGSLSRSVIERIADNAAGDARLAIAILRRAAMYCNDTHKDWITENVVESVESEARQEIASRYIEKLSTDQRILYQVVREQGPIGSGDLYARYRGQASDPKTDRMLRSYLRSMRREGLIEKTGGGPSTQYKLVE